MATELVIAEFTGRYRCDLRRFTFEGWASLPCNRRWGHDATITIGETVYEEVHGDNWPHDDPRWPKLCTFCGYAFADDDQWQHNDNRIYKMPDGAEFTMWGLDEKKPPPGAMVRIPWYDEFAGGKESWLVILPDGGQWITTQKATGGGGWEVTGVPPKITVNPSIYHAAPTGWHGYIRDGIAKEVSEP